MENCVTCHVTRGYFGRNPVGDSIDTQWKHGVCKVLPCVCENRHVKITDIGYSSLLTLLH